MEFQIAEIITWILLAFCCFLAILHFYCNSYVGLWEKVGVPGPKPWPILNHLPDLRNGLNPALAKWRARFGRTFGVYGILSRNATLVTTDTKLLTQILVKDFSNYADRLNVKFTNSTMVDGLFFQQGNDWRRHRHVLSPMFTGGKLKLMLHHANDSAANLVKLIKETKTQGGLIPLKKFTGKYTSDVIAKSGFGLNAKAVEKEDNEFSRNICNSFQVATRWQLTFRAISLYFPWVMGFAMKYIKGVDGIFPEAESYFVALCKSAIESKRESKKRGGTPSKQKDMLDFMLDVETSDDKTFPEDEKTLSTKDIIGNSTLLILAAFETTSSTLRAILYLLARNPDIQEKVIEEIDQVMAGHEQPEYDQLPQLKYTEQVINEALRLFPPVAAITRHVLETRSYDGIVLPKGTNVFIPIVDILKDPQYFPDPEKFDPDRFSPEQLNNSKTDAIAFMPFGYGPRLCVGKRLALLEIKVLLCQLLTQVKFIQTERTEPKKGHDAKWLNLDIGFLQPEKPIELDVVLRQGE